MKALKIVLYVLLALLILGGIYYVINKTQNDSANADVFRAIPEDADAVAVVNMEAFMKLFFSNMGDVWELSEDFKDNKRAEKFQSEAKLSGINLSRKVAIFAENDRFNILVPIKSESDFSSYIQKMVDESKMTSLGDNKFYYDEMNALVTYNNELCLMTQCRKNDVKSGEETWSRILANSALETDVQGPLKELQNSDEHLAFFMKEDEMAARSNEFKHSPQNISRVTFEDGKIRMSSVLSTENTSVSNPLIDSDNQEISSDYLSFHIHVDPDANWEYWLTEQTLENLNRGLSQAGENEELLKNWGGSTNFALTGIESGIGEVITYDYDENFELVEKMEVKEYSRLGYVGNSSFKTEVPTDVDLEKLVPGQITYSSAEGNTLWFGSKEEFDTSTSDKSAALHLKATPANLIDLAIDLGVPMAIMADRFKVLAKDIELTANPIGQTIESELIITIPEEDKNALIYLIGQMQQLNF